jgi:hypothetical protein
VVAARAGNELRSLLREYFPGFLAAFAGGSATNLATADARAHVSSPFGARARARCPASSPDPPWRKAAPLGTESCCLSAAGLGFLGHPVPAREIGLPHSRPTGTDSSRTRVGFPRSTCLQDPAGEGAVYTRGRRCSPDQLVTTVVACHFSAASPAPRCCIHLSGAHCDEASATVHSRSPIRPSPHLRPRMEQGPLRLLPLSFAPRRYQRRTSGWGRATEHSPGLRHQRHRRPPTQRATYTCDLVSHSLSVPSVDGLDQDLDTPDSPTTEGTSTLRPAETRATHPRIEA